MVNFGERIYQLRKDLGLSQEEIAAKMNVSRQTISNWENGGAHPTIDKAVELANLFDVSLDELVGKQVQPTKKSSEVLQALLQQQVTIYIKPETDAWVSIKKTTLKNCEIIEINPTSIRFIVQEKKQRIERLLFLKDIIGFEKEGD